MRDELISLNTDNIYLTPSIIAGVRVLVVRDAMLEVLMNPLLVPQGQVPLPPERRGWAAELSEPAKSMGENNVEMVDNPGATAGADLQNVQEQQQDRDGGGQGKEDGGPPQVPTPCPLLRQIDPQQQLNTFEIAESLAHTDIDTCIDYTRQFLVDITCLVEEALDEKLPPELVASIEGNVVNSRAVYKRVLELNKEIYYAHVHRLSDNAIVSAAKSKKAAAMLLDLNSVSKEQLRKLRHVEREFAVADIDARNALQAAQIEVNQLLQVNCSEVSTARGACHSVQAAKSAEVATCIEKWERFFGIRQNFIVQLEEIFFEVRFYSQFTIKKSSF